MTQLESNKIITDFMQLVPKEYNGIYQFSDGVYFSSSSKDKQKVQNSIYEYVKYATDWNWLMLVVEKIESLGFDFNILTPTVIGIFSDEGKNLICYDGKENKIDAVYNACVEFIKFYNSAKEE